MLSVLIGCHGMRSQLCANIAVINLCKFKGFVDYKFNVAFYGFCIVLTLSQASLGFYVSSVQVF